MDFVKKILYQNISLLLTWVSLYILNFFLCSTCNDFLFFNIMLASIKEVNGVI